jgi:peptidoglycan-associated lipoprotein
MEHAKLESSSCSCFWLKGGSVDGAVTFYRGFGLAANLTAEHTSNIAPGENLGKVSVMAGPRYTYNTFLYIRHPLREYGMQVFGEWLVGRVHGFDSVFPGSNSVTSSAGSFSTQLGIGTDIAIHGGFGIRPVELDYVHTSFPNYGANSQNDLRLAFGLSYRLTAR